MFYVSPKNMLHTRQQLVLWCEEIVQGQRETQHPYVASRPPYTYSPHKIFIYIASQTYWISKTNNVYLDCYRGKEWFARRFFLKTYLISMKDILAVSVKINSCPGRLPCQIMSNVKRFALSTNTAASINSPYRDDLNICNCYSCD